MTLSDSVRDSIAGQDFASGVSVTSVRNPIEHFEGLTGTRMQVYPSGYDRQRETRSSFVETFDISVSVEQRVNLRSFDSEVDTLSSLAFEAFEYFSSLEVSGFGLDAESSQEPLYSIDEIRETGEFKTVMSVSFRRSVSIG